MKLGITTGRSLCGNVVQLVHASDMKQRTSRRDRDDVARIVATGRLLGPHLQGAAEYLRMRTLDLSFLLAGLEGTPCPPHCSTISRLWHEAGARAAQNRKAA
jgi:hypothetical protein